MEYYLAINQNGDVCCIGTTYISMDGFKTVQIETDEYIDFDKLNGYRYIDGLLVFDEQKWQKAQDGFILDDLRSKREIDCFSIINRGNAWYDMYVNTEERKQELQEWYQAWLDVTETRIIPIKPNWII